MEESPKKHYKITLEPVVAALTPHAMALISNDMYLMASGYKHDAKISLAQHYIYCASIELAMKAAILADDCTKERKAEIKSFGHNLEKLIIRFETLYREFFTIEEKAALLQINKYYQNKGLEYFTIDMMGAALTGYKDIPPLRQLQTVATKVNTFSNEEKLFVKARTTEKPGGGFINFL